jgi:putative peptidoglycan binding protein/L,D-transpeptidase-like protein
VTHASLRSGSIARVVLICLALATFGLVLGDPPNATALAGARLSGVTGVQQAAPLLRLGSRGPEVRALQITLARSTYLPYSGVDGIFGMQTWHAVIAFQGWSGLTRDGIVGPRTRTALTSAKAPTSWSRATGFEIRIPQQVLLVVRDGRVQRSIHVSTGARGATPLGHFRIYRREPMSWSTQFRVWMPLAQYFYGGYAMHEFASVPAYPASHGCVRIASTDSRAVWQAGQIGMRVWTAR